MSDHVLHQLSKISASLITTVTVVVFFQIYRRRVADSWAFILALVYALGTAAFAVSSQGLWQHGSACLMVALGIWALDRMDTDKRMAYALGAFAVLAVSARTATAFLATGFMLAAACRGGLQGFRRAVVGALIPGLLLLGYWVGVVHAWFPAEFQIQNSMLHPPPKIMALLGLLFSPGRGIFLFSPVLAFVLWGAIALWRSTARWVERSTMGVLGCSVAATFLLLASYAAWEGGFSFGSRYAIESITMLFYFLPAAIPLIEKNLMARRTWWTCVGLAILCNAMGAYNGWEWEKIVFSESVWSWKAYPTLFVLTSLF